MSIVGQSQSGTIIDSQQYGLPIFTISKGVTVTLKSLTLENGVGNDGGAVNNSGNLNVVNSTFKKNTAVAHGATVVYGKGGAINNYGNLTVIGSTFTGNIAGSGGAIYNSGNMNVKSSTFTGNKANIAGAIYNQGNMNAQNSTFTSNQATENGAPCGFGGAIYNTKTLSITSCTFKNNVGPLSGGAIYNNGSLKVTGGNFTGNKANDDGTGGAIYNIGTGTATNSNFMSSMSASGAICNEKTFTANNCVFKDNGGLSAAAITNSPTGTFTVQKSSFTGNAVDNTAGAIENGGTMIITGSTFTGNNATNEGTGGAIVNTGNLRITSSSFKNNIAYYQGGAIINNGRLNVVNSAFTGNTVTFSNGGGGAIFNYDNLTVTGSTFTNNKAGDGAAICNYGKTNVNFSRFIGNKAVWEGNAIFNSGSSVDATNNWWGTNKPNFKSLIYGDDVNRSTWMMLRISASITSVAIQSPSKITADLTWNTKDGVKPYKQPSGGYVPDGTTAKFGIQTGKGNISPKTSTTTHGKAYSTFTGTALGKATIYTQVDNQKQSINVTVKQVKVTISQLITASATIKKYYESHNHKLPTSVNVAGQTVTMPQLLKLLVTATLNINKSNMNPVTVGAVGNPPSSGGVYASGKLYNYITIAGNINTFINSKGRAPNYATTYLGKIPFSKQVYTYAKVVNFYGQHKRLPNYVKI